MVGEEQCGWQRMIEVEDDRGWKQILGQGQRLFSGARRTRADRAERRIELKAGVDIRKVSKALGHSSVTITERYYAKWNKAQQDILDGDLASAWRK